MISEIRQDVRYSLNLAFRRPLFTLTIVVSLALGVGLSTAVFSFLNAVLLRPLPGARRARKGPSRSRARSSRAISSASWAVSPSWDEGFPR
jgi:hypothetical protein